MRLEWIRHIVRFRFSRGGVVCTVLRCGIEGNMHCLGDSKKRCCVSDFATAAAHTTPPSCPLDFMLVTVGCETETKFW